MLCFLHMVNKLLDSLSVTEKLEQFILSVHSLIITSYCFSLLSG